MPWSRQYATTTSFRNSLPLSVSSPHREKGRDSRSFVNASVIGAPSRTRSATHSVHPDATSVTVSVCAKLPLAFGPEWDTRSASTKPGTGSFQSVKVRTGTRRRILVVFPEPRRWRRAPTLLGVTSNRSMVAALAESNFVLTSWSRLRCPCRSSASRRVGMIALSRLPQTRSEASHSTTSASATASP